MVDRYITNADICHLSYIGISRSDFYFDGAENGSSWAHSAHILPRSLLPLIVLSRGWPIDRPADQSADFGIFLMNRHRPIVLQIRPINIQAQLQATCEAASCGKQIALPLAQRITLWCPLCLLTFWRENSVSRHHCATWRSVQYFSLSYCSVNARAHRKS